MALIFSAIHLARLVLAIVSWDLLAELLPYWPGYLIFTGLVWTLIGAKLFCGLLNGQEWVYRHILAAYLTYSIYNWLEYMFIPGDPLRRQNGWFVLGFNILILLLGVWVFSRPKTKSFFMEDAHERSTEDQPAA